MTLTHNELDSALEEKRRLPFFRTTSIQHFLLEHSKKREKVAAILVLLQKIPTYIEAKMENTIKTR